VRGFIFVDEPLPTRIDAHQVYGFLVRVHVLVYVEIIAREVSQIVK